MKFSLAISAVLLIAIFATSHAVEADNSDATPSYNHDVRPILSGNCFHCHGPDEENREAEVRLDVSGELDLEALVVRITYGQTDDFSYNIVENLVHVRDFNATILHQLGIDHNRLTFPFLGLDQRLTGVEEAHVIHGILS